jgi:hypothetical protein
MTRMPFGKHKDVELADVPRQYLLWLRRQPWLGAWLVRAIGDELSDKAAASGEESFEAMLVKGKRTNAKNERTTTNER